MQKIDQALGIIFLILNTILLLFIGNIIRFLVIGYTMLIIGAALKFNKPIKKSSKSIITVDENTILLKAKRESEEIEREQFQNDFMKSLKKTIDNSSDVSIMKEAWLLSKNGRLNNWEKRCRKKE